MASFYSSVVAWLAYTVLAPLLLLLRPLPLPPIVPEEGLCIEKPSAIVGGGLEASNLDAASAAFFASSSSF